MAQEQVSTEYIPIEEHCYGPSSRHTLDLYRPPPLVSARGQTVQKVLLVWLHGGGWVDRSKDEFGHVARGLVRAGAGIISVAMVNYHLSPRTRPPSLIHPTHVLDVARALCWPVPAPHHRCFSLLSSDVRHLSHWDTAGWQHTSAKQRCGFVAIQQARTLRASWLSTLPT